MVTSVSPKPYKKRILGVVYSAVSVAGSFREHVIFGTLLLGPCWMPLAHTDPGRRTLSCLSWSPPPRGKDSSMVLP